MILYQFERGVGVGGGGEGYEKQPEEDHLFSPLCTGLPPLKSWGLNTTTIRGD